MAADEVRAGDALYDVVTACALRVFKNPYRGNQNPMDNRVMGNGTGTYVFSASELRSYCGDVVKAVNEDMGSAFGLTISVKIAWTYGQTRDAIWNDCFKQMKTGAALFARLGAAK